MNRTEFVANDTREAAEELLRKAGVIASGAAGPLVIGSDVEIAQRVAAMLRANFEGHAVWCEGEFLVYNGKCWEAAQDHEMRRLVHKWDGAAVGRAAPVRLGKSRINSILGEAAAVLFERDWFATHRFGINCLNGFVEFVGGAPVLVPHDPAHRQRHVIPAEWAGSLSIGGSLLERLLTAPFVGDADAAEKVALLGEIAGSAGMGYATELLSPKAVVCIGGGAENGKSQLLRLMRGVLPKRAVSAIPPTKFGDDTYRIKLVGKLLNTSDELGSSRAISGEMFKYLVTGEQVSARDLYSSVVDFCSTAQHVFACNNLPPVQGGMDRGVLRRLLVLEFRRTIPVEERILHIADRVLRTEMPLVLSWLVESAARLMRQGAFTVPASSKAALDGWAQGVDPILGWIAERLVRGPTYKVETNAAYTDFIGWAHERGHIHLPVMNKFSARLSNEGLRHAKSGSFRGFIGVRLKTMQEGLGL